MKVAALRFIALIALSAAGAWPVAADEASPKSAAMSRGWGFSEQGGAALFQNVCAGCHQPDAKGAVGAGAYPSLVADDQLASADFVVSALLGGLKAMPPVGDMMSDAQVTDVVNYVRTHFGNAYSDAVSAESVSAARRLAASAP
jgi:mono/diheme cytochrome c family protein